MCEPTTLMIAATAMQATSTVMTGYQARQQGKFQEGVSKYNAARMRNEATQVRNKSVEQENTLRRQVAEQQARQRTQAAGSGVDVGSGSALQLQEDTALLGEVDALRIRSNFEQQAQGLEDQAYLTEEEGKNARKRGRNQFTASIFGGLGQGLQGYGLANGWYGPNSAAATTTGVA